jgi:rhodanese-related sulfurtransferase
MRQISTRELKAWFDDVTRPPPVILDVREPWELEKCPFPGARAMPMRTVPGYVAALRRQPGCDGDIVLVCHHGARSYQVGLFLEQQGFSSLYNLYGGVAAWAREVDATRPTY